MKVGIITFHDSNNYGAALQAAALRKTISKYHECEIIDYKCTKISGEEKIKVLENSKGIKNLIKKYLTLGYYKKKNLNFKSFLSHNGVSNHTYNKDNINDANDVYDAFISGSDQVLNLNLTGNDYTYYLDFVNENKKKIGYATSLGSYRFDGNSIKAKQLLAHFDYMSCREPEVTHILKEECGVENVTTVVDPTLLLSKNDWLEMQEKYEHHPEKYILLYLISPEKRYFDFALSVSKQLNLPLLYICYSAKKYRNKQIKHLTDVSPSQFIYLINNSSFIVTNSFHGTALSSILEKDFVVIKDCSREKSNQRIDRILKITNLENKFIESPDDIDYASIDYSDRVERLKREKEKSLQFLQEAGMVVRNE